MTNKYYQKHKAELRKEARGRHQNLSGEEKEKRRKKARERYLNITEEENKKGVSVIRNISRSYLSIEKVNI